MTSALNSTYCTTCLLYTSVCDLTIASENAKFGQTGPRVGSFDAGYGAGYLARMIGHKRAREV